MNIEYHRLQIELSDLSKTTFFRFSFLFYRKLSLLVENTFLKLVSDDILTDQMVDCLGRKREYVARVLITVHKLCPWLIIRKRFISIVRDKKHESSVKLIRRLSFRFSKLDYTSRWAFLFEV